MHLQGIIKFYRGGKKKLKQAERNPDIQIFPRIDFYSTCTKKKKKKRREKKKGFLHRCGVWVPPAPSGLGTGCETPGSPRGWEGAPQWDPAAPSLLFAFDSTPWF